MTKKRDIRRLQTGVANLDEILQGGLPQGSVTVVSGTPGSGKTILTQQICFYNASPKHKVLFFGTLSEPTAKTLRQSRVAARHHPAKARRGRTYPSGDDRRNG